MAQAAAVAAECDHFISLRCHRYCVACGFRINNHVGNIFGKGGECTQKSHLKQLAEYDFTCCADCGVDLVSATSAT